MAEKFLEKVPSKRRDFLRSVLGAGFALPVVAAFSIEALTADSALAQNMSNTSGISNQGPYLLDWFFN